MTRTETVLPCVLLPLVLGGCATLVETPTNNVRATLSRYEVGKTTFADFKRDARLVYTVREMNNPWYGKSYINPKPQPKKITINGWQTAPGSPWKIYETSTYYFIQGPKRIDERTFAVGDAEHAMAILTFEAETVLKKKKAIRP